jgi:hypothetical protein
METTMFGFNTHRDETSRESRERYARSIEQTIHDARSPQPPWSLYRWQIFRPRVVAACAAALTEIVAVLRDPTRDLSADARAHLRWLLTEGAVSPLHGVDPGEAAAACTDALAQLRGEPVKPVRRTRVAV